MNDLFELWWKDSNAADFAGGDDPPHVAAAAKELARGAFNDGAQLALSRIVFKIAAVRKQAKVELEGHQPGSPARMAVAEVVNMLGKLVVSVAEMEV